MDIIVMISFGSVLCAMTALNFIDCAASARSWNPSCRTQNRHLTSDTRPLAPLRASTTQPLFGIAERKQRLQGSSPCSE